MATILLLHSSIDGHTVRICQRLKAVLEEHGHHVNLCPIDDCAETDLRDLDAIVIGASIRYGKHRQSVFDFIERHRALLEKKPNAFFSVNIVARKAGKDTPETNPYVCRFLERASWRPQKTAVFAGKLDYPKCRPVDRMMIRLIMWITGGPTDPEAVVEFTDWRKVEDFGRDLGRSWMPDLPSAPGAS